ncbi:DUF1758 domain-containing protein [Camponotus japonicus]
MADQIKLIVQKRTSLKAQITNLNNLFDKNKIDDATLRLRIARLTELFHAFEDHHDELMVLEPNENYQDEFHALQERYYDLAGKVENHLKRASTSNSDIDTSNVVNRVNQSTPSMTDKKRRIKLPEAPLPTFDGKYESWLSFKNAFRNLIDSQSDLSDVDKLYYLRSALKGDAANKIKIFAIDGINYSKAWEVLERAYEVKRILISRHLSAILNLPTLDKETTVGLSKIADETQQHLASLNALNVSVGQEMIVHILESKLPKNTLEKWETSLDRDEYPALELLYEFLYKTAVCASKRERARSTEAEQSKSEHPAKKKQNYSSNRAFVLNASRNCKVCNTKQHPLYMCDKFKQLPVNRRIETVKNAKLCYNCLRSHLGSPCKFSNCTICQRKHNTLLHLENPATVTKPDESKSNTNQVD